MLLTYFIAKLALPHLLTLDQIRFRPQISQSSGAFQEENLKVAVIRYYI